MICIVDDIALRYPFAFFIELFLVLWKRPCVLVLVKWWYPPGTQSSSQVFCRVHPEFWQTEKKVLNFEGPFPGLEKVWKNGQSLSGSGESLNFFKIINFSHFRQAGKRDCNRKYFCGKKQKKKCDKCWCRKREHSGTPLSLVSGNKMFSNQGRWLGWV